MNDAIGRQRTLEDVIAPGRVRALAATLDLGTDDSRFRAGAQLPAGWHWVFFHEAIPRSALGPDGHEARGDFLPAIDLERRMWAGGQVRFVRPLTIGSAVRRVSTVRSVVEKDGRSGPLAFVTVQHEIHDADGVALEERQDLVYLNRPPATAAARATTTAREASSSPPAWSETFTPDEVTLFRFSALTFNGHRIHYDRRFAVDVEGYPDLVVHGPLVALLLLNAGARRLEGPPSSFEYRAVGPAFCEETIELRGEAAGEAVHPQSYALEARTGGRQIMRATLTT